MKDWHALWSLWTRPDAQGTDALSNWREAQASMWDQWLAGAQQWWSWWLASATTPWLQQAWPHAGELDGVPAALHHTAAARGQLTAPAASATPPLRKEQTGRPERKNKHLQRRKINPGA